MARDLGKFGIRTVAIAPGVFITPLNDFAPEEVKDSLIKDTPMGRPGDLQEFAHFVGTLIENSYINGVHLRIDGAMKISHK